MKSVQITKQLNNTELGKSGTHDTYVLVPQTLDISDVFPEPNKVYDFIDRETGFVYPIRHTIGREKRIVGLGPYYSAKDLYAGDSITLECRIINNEYTRIIDYAKKINTLVIQKAASGFELLTPDRKDMINENVSVQGKPLAIEFLVSKKKRQDSPEETDYYDVKVGDKSLIGDYSTKEYAVIEIDQNQTRIERFCAWTKAFIETED